MTREVTRNEVGNKKSTAKALAGCEGEKGGKETHFEGREYCIRRRFTIGQVGEWVEVLCLITQATRSAWCICSFTLLSGQSFYRMQMRPDRLCH